jgi:hypothetical protein
LKAENRKAPGTRSRFNKLMGKYPRFKAAEVAAVGAEGDEMGES